MSHATTTTEHHGINLVKGESCAVQPGIRRVMVGCGWEPQLDRSAHKFDLDVSCVLLNAQGRMPSKHHYVYWGCKEFERDVVVHTGDNLTGDGDGDDERLLIDLGRVPDDVVQIDVYCNIYEGRARDQCFGMISDCYLRIVDITEEHDVSRAGPLYVATSYPNREFCRFRVNDEAVHSICVLFGSLCRGSGAWRFQAIQKDLYGGLDVMLQSVKPAHDPPPQRALCRFNNGGGGGQPLQALQQGLQALAPVQDAPRAVLAVVGVGALLLNTVGIIPLVCLAAFLWLSVGRRQ